MSPPSERQPSVSPLNTLTTSGPIRSGLAMASSAPLRFRVSQAAITPGKLNIPKAPDNRLNFHQTMYYDDFLEVEVLPFQGMVGRSIVLQWVGPYASWTSDPQVPNTQQTLTFNVPRLEVIDAIGRSVEIHYTISGAAPSPKLTLTIDSQNMVMPPPRFYLQSNQPTAAVSILSQDQQQGHTGRVRWYGIESTPWDSEERHLQANRAEYFQVPRNLVDANRGRLVLINYTIYRGSHEPQFRFSRILRLQL